MTRTSYKSQLMLGLSALVFLLVPMVSWATTLVPTDLNPGDTYHLVFVSSTSRDATSTNIDDYDDHVQAAADAAGIGVGSLIGDITWLAIGSTPTVDAITHIGVSGPVYLLTDTRIANDEADLFDGFITVPISVDETGGTPIDKLVITGTLFTGFGGSFAVLGDPSIAVRVGRSTDDDRDLINTGFAPITEVHPG